MTARDIPVTVSSIVRTVTSLVDGEPTIKRFAATRITSLNGEIKSRLSPAYSHQSLGACERWHTKLFNPLRLLRQQMSELFGLPINGQTPYSRTWGQKYKSAIFAFGETVPRQHSNHDNHKSPVRLGPQWSLVREALIKSLQDGRVVNVKSRSRGKGKGRVIFVSPVRVGKARSKGNRKERQSNHERQSNQDQ
eukprot:4452961-Amphidinium_carterae.5